MTYPAADVLAHLRKVYDEADEDLEGEALIIAIDKTMRERFPDLGGLELIAAFDALFEEHRTEDLEAAAENAGLHRVVAICERHGVGPDVTMEEGLRIAAGRGDQEAEAFLSEMAAPEWRVREALHDAACDAHPAWRREGAGRVWTHVPDGGAYLDETAIVDWYQRTHPREASAITDRIMSGRA